MTGMDLVLIAIGITAGALSGLVGVGGGIIIVPSLVLLAGFSQKHAQGTTLAMLCMPVALLAALTYYRAGYVNLKAALWIGAGFLIGAFVGSHYAIKMPEHTVTRVFGGVLLVVAAKLLVLGH